MDNRNISDDVVEGESWRTIPGDLKNPESSGEDLQGQQARRWGQVLAARRIPSLIEVSGKGFRIRVPPALHATAVRELHLFEEENRGWPPPAPPSEERGGSPLPPLSVLILLATFHNLTRLDLGPHGLFSPDWAALGNAHAGAILSGEWWRSITALTLHADGVHLLGNLALGAPFVLLLCRDLGSGLAWSLILASGAFGNLANAVLQLPDHHAVGASTAVFGAVGILAALALLRQRPPLTGRRLLPGAAALALLALLGTGGERTDLGAHLFGFASGMVFGLLAALILARRGRPGPLLNRLLALASPLVVLCAWVAALLHG